MTLILYICVFIVPLIMLIVGLIGRAKPKTEINATVGYRSRRSKASQEAWDLAQRLMAKYMITGAIVNLVIGIIGSFIIGAQGGDTGSAIAMTVIVLVQAVVLILVIPLVERKLKEKFG